MKGEAKMFPRGGKRKCDPEDDDKPTHSVQKKRKVSKSKQAPATKPKKQTDVDCLSFQTLAEGMLLFGRVREVQDYKVMVSLPQGLFATLPITAISPAYTQHLESVAESEQDGQETPSLKDHFSFGDGIPCCITSVSTKNAKHSVEVSTFPSQLYKDFPRDALKKGCLLYGAIQSMEEHGCTVDVGIPNMKAFLPTTGVPEEDSRLAVGKGLWCTVSTETALDVLSGEAAVIRVTIDNVLDAEVTKGMISSVECLRPGMKIKATVEKVLKGGLHVKCIKYRGCVHRSHVPEPLSHYAVGQEVEGRVLYTHPITKIISISLLPAIVGCIDLSEQPFGGLTIGDFVEDAKVMHGNKDDGVFFKLQDSTALASRHHLSDGKIKDVSKAFPTGSNHRCRVIGFQPADDVILVSMKESVMNQKILSIADMKPGQIVECTVQAIHDSGVIVLLTKGLTGLISKMHVSDIPLKNISKKFPKGLKLKCRVLKVNVDKKKVYLTKKKSLVNTNQIIPTSYSGLKNGMQLEGFVLLVKDNGVVVGFCNDVKGWVPRNELSSVEIAHPQTAFFQGQVVRCRVLSCQPDTRSLRLSFVISGKAAIASKKEKMADFEAGKMMDAKVIKKMGKNFEIQLQPCGTKALLPMEHLSDSADNQNLLWQSIQAGDSLDSVMLLKESNVPIVTMKESFISAAREDLIPKSVEDLEPGQLLPAAIRNHQSYGVFVELPGGLGGLVPHKLAMDRPLSDISQVYTRGQSVVVKIIEVKEENGRFLCSLRMCDCYDDNPKVSVEMLETYLNERDNYLHCVLDEKAQGLKMGSLIKVTVKDKTKEGYICETSYGMPAVISISNIEGAELMIGSEVEGVVLHIAVDQSNCCLELSADSALVKAVSRRFEKPHMDKAKPGQTVKAQVALIRDDIVVMTLKQHAVGMLAAIPRRQHLNDVLAGTTSNLTVGEEIKVTIQKCEGDRVLAILASLAKDEEILPRHTLKMGQVVSAKVKSILPGQMNIRIGDVKARVHNTEVVDEIADGTCAFSKYSKGQDIHVKIIGFRHFRSFRYLPISHPRLHKASPDCTVKPSKMQKEDCPVEDQALYVRDYKEGDKVLVFVIKFENNKLWVNISPTQRGVVSIFDVSKDLGFLKHADKHFKTGHGYKATVIGVEDEGLVHLSFTGTKEVVKRNRVVTGKVTSISDHGLAMRLPGDFRGMVSANSEETINFKGISVGSFVRCLVLCCNDKEKCILSLNLNHRSEEDLKKVKRAQLNSRKRKSSETEMEGGSSKRRKSETEAKETATEDVEEKMETQPSVEEKKEAEKRLNVSAGFNWDQAPQAMSDSDEESEEEEDDAQISAKEKKRASMQPDSKTNVEGKPDFAKLLANSPNDSMLWIQYMFDQLQDGKVDKARSVANVALQTIAMEEQQEKLNIWIALMNLENQYGNKEELDKTLHRALEVTDPLKIYRRVSAMYTASGNMEQAEHIHKTMLRKFKKDRQVWIDYGLFLYKNDKAEEARKLLSRAFLSIDRKDHVTLITQFASLECKHGVAERGFTMFNKVVTEFPKRIDVLTVYTDMAVMLGNVDKARELFERIWTLKPSPRLFKKYLQFEEKHGTEETLERLKARIADES